MSDLINIVVNEENRVVLEGEEAGDFVLGCSYGEAKAEFEEHFWIVGDDFPGNPAEDYYQGMEFTSVIRRKSDGKLFGYTYWKPLAKYGDWDLETNGEDHGFETEYDDDYEEILKGPFWVWLPVESFNVQGYKVME